MKVRIYGATDVERTVGIPSEWSDFETYPEPRLASPPPGHPRLVKGASLETFYAYAGPEGGLEFDVSPEDAKLIRDHLWCGEGAGRQDGRFAVVLPTGDLLTLERAGCCDLVVIERAPREGLR